jgi:alpha-glucosidase
MGEPAWSNVEATERLYMQHHAGMHEEIHNVYGLTWDKVVKEQFEKHNPGKRVFQMTRAAYAGLQRYTFGWSGDSGSGEDVLDGWGRLANQVTMGLSAGMGGIPFWATDISGYCGDIKDHAAMAELYTRWMQFGVFNPLSRAHHEGDNAVEPWMFGEEAERNSRAAIELKYKLFPYIYTYAREAHDYGWPLMRALLLEFPEDPEAHFINDQFMFGKELLVAPVLKKGAQTRRLYLPEGDWIDFHNPRQHFEGGQQLSVKATLDKIPIFVKKGSIVPMMPVMQYIHEKRDYPLSLHIYPANPGDSASFELYEDDGETTKYLEDSYSRTRFSCYTKEQSYLVRLHKPVQRGYQAPGKRDYIVQLYLNEKPDNVIINGKRLKSVKPARYQPKLGEVTGEREWGWDAVNGICYIRIPAGAETASIEIVK